MDPNRQDRFAHLYVSACLEVMHRAPQEVMDVANRNLRLFSDQRLGNQRYIDRWRDLLTQGPSCVAEVVLADTDEAQVLRSTAPFAGLLPQDEVQRLRRMANGVRQ